MLILLAPALAADLPWTCPTITVPADASPLRDTDGGLRAAWEAVGAELVPWLAECDWTSVTLEDGSDASRCATSAGATLTYVRYADDSPASARVDWPSLGIVLIVEPPAGATTWSSITWGSYEENTSEEGWVSRRNRYAAEWTGAIAGLPDDGFLSASEWEYGAQFPELYVDREYATPDCAWSYHTYLESWTYETVVVHARTVEVDPFTTCDGERPYLAKIDGVRVGAVDPETWERLAADADGDGFSLAGADCDDADPAVYACAEDLVGDGVDQDCDGADGVADTGDSGTTEAADTDEPEAAEPVRGTPRGCAGAAAILVLLPLARRRRP